MKIKLQGNKKRSIKRKMKQKKIDERKIDKQSCHHSSVVPSAPTTLWPWVQIQRTTTTPQFDQFIFEL